MTKNKILFTTILFLFITLFTSQLFAKTYKIACVEDYYPYTTLNKNGEPEGIIIDWWNLWSIKSGVEVEFIPMDIKSCIEQTKNGKIDIIAGLFYSDERAKYLDFSEPIIRMRTVIFLKNKIKADSIKFINISIGLVENSLTHLYMQENFPQVKLNIFKTNTTLLNAIYLKNVDGFAFDVPNAIGNYKQHSPPRGYYLFETLFTERLRSAVKKGNSELLSLITSGVSKVSDEELLEIADKWKLLKKDRTLLWWSIGIGFFLILIIVFLLVKSIKNKQKRKNALAFETKTDWQVIVEKGENDLIEFKSSLRWDFRQEKVNKSLESVISKTISAFLNTEGGMLFIGIDDDGNAIGLENDYKTMSKKNRDGFMLALTNLINQDLGKSSHLFLSINIISLNEKDVCIVSVEKSDKPVFCGKNEKEEFYIRASASSQPLGMRESFKYINSHWGASQ